MINIHGTLISVDGKGVLLKGESGCGKSDLALRFIKTENAKLVADDRVDVDVDIIDNNLIGKAPLILKNKLEVRNIGIIEDLDTVEQEDIFLCVELVKNRESLERLPQEEFEIILDKKIPKIKLYAFDCSTICKILVKISSIINKR